MSHSSHRENYQINPKKEHNIKRKTHETKKELDTTNCQLSMLYIYVAYTYT
jgi:hypothetical protein